MDITYRAAKFEDLEDAERVVQEAGNELRVRHGRQPWPAPPPIAFPKFCLAEDPDGHLFAGKNAGTSHWEDHAEDELVHVLDGTKILDIVCDDGSPKSFELRAGMITIVPKGTWHRFRCAEGGTTWSATLPGDHIESDVDDPRTAEPQRVMPSGTLGIIDLNAELAKLTMFRGRTPKSTMADRQGSAARLAPYRDGGLSITKFAG